MKRSLSSARRPWLALCAALLAAAPAAARDGALEINQACAVNTGCFSGDAAGFPVTISQPGSYVVTSNLDVPPDTDGFEVTVADVTLDLNGSVLSAQTPTSGDGVRLTGGNVEVRNGTIRDFDTAVVAIFNAPNARLIDLRVIGGTGFFLDAVGHLVDRCTVAGTSSVGISVSNEATIRNSTVDSLSDNSALGPNTIVLESNVIGSTSINATQTTVIELGDNVCGGTLGCP